jgi:hypothetical protein
MLAWIDGLGLFGLIALIVISGVFYFALILFVARVCGLHNRGER